MRSFGVGLLMLGPKEGICLQDAMRCMSRGECEGRAEFRVSPVEQAPVAGGGQQAGLQDLQSRAQPFHLIQGA